MERNIQVFLDAPQAPVLVGTLWTRSRQGVESATFTYDADWLAREARFALVPELPLTAGPHHTPPGRALFGALADSAPDRWGRELMRRDARRRARGGPPATLLEIDYLLRVSDFGRLGALRFSTSERGPFLAPDDVAPIPPLVELPALLAASDDVLARDDESDALRVLLAPGSSLGGARPKASVRDVDGALAIAKFPARTDDFSVVRWEAVALLLAERAGIDVPQRRLETIGNAPVLLLRRFDRRANARVPFLSAMAALGAADHERRSYPEFVDFIRQHGAHPKQDLHALWRRMVFNVLISNTDDHLRNHGFLHAPGRGWTLSPAYDLNPTPTDLKPRVLATAIDFDDATASLQLAFDVAPYFELDAAAAWRIAAEVAQATVDWRGAAERFGISGTEIRRMASAFEHQDLELARRE